MGRNLFLATIACALVAAPAAVAAAPGSTEHGVNRDKLALKAEAVIEERNGIEVLNISRCGPTKKKGRPNYSKWICEWRAEGLWPGQVPYACAGDARWKRKGNRWRVERCDNRLQPQAPLREVPNPEPAFGYNDDWIFQSEAALDVLDESGGDVARTGLAWSGIERSPGGFDWYGSDLLYEKLVDRGIRPLWAIMGAPCWAQPDPRACEAGEQQMRPSPAHYDDFARFAVKVAERYPTSVGIEVWNEPNYPRFWGGWPEPQRYAQMLSKVADALHRDVPGMPVVSAGLSPHSDSDKKAIGYRNFLIEMYESGAAQKADAIGIHPYPGVGPDEDYIGDVRVYLGKTQNVMQRYGDASTGMWATEFGASTTGPHAFSPEGHADAIVKLYDLLRHVDRVDMAIVHSLIETPELAEREAGFGLVRTDLTPKPAFCAISAVRGASPRICD